MAESGRLGFKPDPLPFTACLLSPLSCPFCTVSIKVEKGLPPKKLMLLKVALQAIEKGVLSSYNLNSSLMHVQYIYDQNRHRQLET